MKLRILAAVAAVWCGVSGAQAQTYPSRPVTLIVPLAAGGITDIVARLVGERMKASLGQPVIAENVTGAGGTIGVTRLHRSAPDGHTIAIGQWTTHVGAAAMYPVPFDFVTDFEPLAMLSIAPLWIIGRKDFPAKDIKELLDWMKANPGKATIGTIGPGSATQMCLLYVTGAIGTTVQYVPYRGAAPVMQDMMSGQVDLSCLEGGQTLPQVDAGHIKPYAVLAEKRWFKKPDVPTVTEAGVPGIVMPFGTGCGRRRARRKTSSPSSIGDQRIAGRPRRRARLIDLGHQIAPLAPPDARRARRLPQG